MRISLIVCLLSYCILCKAQTDTAYIQPTGNCTRDLGRLGNEYDRMSASVQRNSLHLLAVLQEKEKKLRCQVSSKDDAAAVSLFSGSTAAYQQLEIQVNNTFSILPSHPLKDYLPGVDSIETALRFLQGQQLPNWMPAHLQSTQEKLLLLQNQLQQANHITAFIQQRQQQLQTQLQAYNLSDKLTAFKKRVYYYKAQIEQYKELLHDPNQLATRVLSTVRSLPAFQKFFLSQSYLSTLFRLPGNSGEATGQPIPGLQTHGEVDAAIAERLGPGANLAAAVTGANGNNNPALEGIQDAHDQLNNLKYKLTGSEGNSNTATADFRPNPQHNKTFFQRIQLGFDMQTQSSTNFVPALSTLGISVGYLLNARSIIGIGAGYKLGWGHPFDHIALSSQGATIRSFLDWRIRGSLWLTGGYEANYFNAFAQLSQLRSISAWQSSTLFGLMKQYKAGKRTGNMQLLFDALYRQHIPRSQPVLFRIGYSFN